MNAQARVLGMAFVLVGASLQAQGTRGDDGQLVSRNACRLHALDHATYSGEYRRAQKVDIAAIDSAFRTLRRPTAADSSEYRRSREDGGEGREEFGGRDVHDVMNLVPLARGDSTLDHDNVYAFGASRGGMMAYLAIRSGLAVRAAVIQAGPTEVARTEALRPGFEKEVYAPLVPGWPRTRAAFYADRSAINWADRLNVPMLILHGTRDWRVDPQDALTLAPRRQAIRAGDVRRRRSRPARQSR